MQRPYFVVPCPPVVIVALGLWGCSAGAKSGQDDAGAPSEMQDEGGAGAVVGGRAGGSGAAGGKGGGSRDAVSIDAPTNTLDAGAMTRDASTGTDVSMMPKRAAFFPVGAYLCCANGAAPDTIIAELRLMAAAGFTSAAFDVGFDTSGKFERVFTVANELGMRVMVENVVDVDGSAGAVARYAKSPGILGWNIGDDLHRKYTAAQVKVMHEAVKKADQTHPDIGIMYNPNLWTPFALADISGIYKYPIADINDNGGTAAGEGAISTVDDWLTAARGLKKPVLGIPQAYAWPNDRFPNPVELRNMAFQMIVNNVTGLIWYAYGRSGSFLGPQRANEWAEVKTNTGEILSLAPILTGGSFSRVSAGNGALRSALWRTPTEVVAIIVNTGAATNVTLPLPLDAGGHASALFPTRSNTLSFGNGVLSGPIGALDVQGYRIVKLN